MSAVEWTDAERGCCFGTCGGDVSKHAPHQDQGCWMFEGVLNYLAPFVAAREAQAAAKVRDEAADVWDAQRHADAIGDTGTSHVLIGRVYAVRCEWCPRLFVGSTKREALAELRRHERAVLDQAHRIERDETS